MLTWEQFDELILEDDKRLRGMTKEFLYTSYVEKIKPYIPVIAEFLSRDTPATQKQLKGALGVSSTVWNASVDIFEDLREVLSVEEDYIQLKADMMLLKGVEETEYRNPKMIEMFQQRYNPLYKPKGQEVELKLPRVEIVFSDESVDEEYLEQYDPNIEHE